jgi:hypothetical protein
MESKKNERIDLVKKYFIKTPERPNYLWDQIRMIAGGVFLLYGLATRDTIGIVAGIIGFLLLLVGFSKYGNKKSAYNKAYNEAEPKASDEQMDQWLNEGQETVEQQARERLDIDADDTKAIPLVFDGPAAKTWIAPGNDKILRFRHHNIIIFFLTDYNIATFQCILDLGSGEILEDKTKEFPYKDITNLETETTNDTFYYINDEKSNVVGIQIFNLYTSGGNKMSANYFFNKGTGDIGYKFPPSTAENTIRAIRKKLKEYKDRSSSSVS